MGTRGSNTNNQAWKSSAEAWRSCLPPVKSPASGHATEHLAKYLFLAGGAVRRGALATQVASRTGVPTLSHQSSPEKTRN